MSDVADRIVAIKAVMDNVPPDVAPVTTIGELELAVDRSKIASTWTTNTLYKVGAIVKPAEENGHSYECIQRGTSQSTAHNYLDWPVRYGAQYAEGNSNPVLIWEEAGTDQFNAGFAEAETNIYDINLASLRCCRNKMRLSAQLIQDGDTHFEQIYEHWKNESKKYRPFTRPLELVRG